MGWRKGIIVLILTLILIIPIILVFIVTDTKYCMGGINLLVRDGFLVFHVIDDLVGDGLQAAELADGHADISGRHADISGRPRRRPPQQIHPLLTAY